MLEAMKKAVAKYNDKHNNNKLHLVRTGGKYKLLSAIQMSPEDIAGLIV